MKAFGQRPPRTPRVLAHPHHLRRTSRPRGPGTSSTGPWPARRHATARDKPVGQWLTDTRRPGGLGKDPIRAERRAVALAAIEPDWNPGALGWTDWQRQYAGLEALLAGGGRLANIVPGVTWHGEDTGRWLATQRRDFGRLSEEQQRRLAELGVKPARAVRARTWPPRPQRPPRRPGEARKPSTRGVQALTQ
ncbi:helicase associated domain-containing protein [Streptomyces sp. NPDC051211]|uniref:helicase associated domain-containing protein n=1 Tax=Streptomyces sp. NPDC051211 TaxID=3154643 RepID=UPI0034500A81